MKQDQIKNLKQGTQIIYVPNHADSIDHPDCEEGFVTSVTENGAFCRYWSKYFSGHLRTVANSEKTNFRNLVIKNTHDQQEINKLIQTMKALPLYYGTVPEK